MTFRTFLARSTSLLTAAAFVSTLSACKDRKLEDIIAELPPEAGTPAPNTQPPNTQPPKTQPPKTPAPRQPPPNPARWQTPEYKKSRFLADINAAQGYASVRVAGTEGGKGVVVGVMDDGIDFNHPDLKGAMAAINPTSSAVQEHGTPIAGIIAARKDDKGMHGVAPDAKLVDLSIPQPDPKPKELITDLLLLRAAAGLDLNRIWAKADIVNMSIGAPATSTDFLAPMQAAAKAGLIMVISAGNGDVGSPALSQPWNPAKFVTDPDIAGQAIAVGNLVPRRLGGPRRYESSHACGDAKKYCIFAPGIWLWTTKKSNTYDPHGADDNYRNFSGTSAAAPVVSGALANLISAFPSRKGAKWIKGDYAGANWYVARILTTAKDLGAPGTDDVYGVGALDLGAALSPVGQITLAMLPQHYATVSTHAIGTLRNGQGMLNFQTLAAFAGIMIYDEDRAPFYANLQHRVAAAPAPRYLARFLDGLGAPTNRHTTSDDDNSGLGFDVAFGFAQSDRQGLGRDHDIASLFNGADMPVALATTTAPMQAMMTHRSSLGLGFALTDTVKLSFSAATDDVEPDDGGAWDPMTDFAQSRTRTHKTLGQLGLTYDGAWGGLMLQAGMLAEKGGLLGSFGTDALSFADTGQSGFVQLGLRRPIIGRLDLLASYTHGWAKAQASANSLWTGVEDLRFDAFTVGASYRGLLASADTLTVTLGQPLRVRSGTATLSVPTGETEDGNVIISQRKVALAPKNRELMVQLGYQTPLIGQAWLNVGSFVRFNPGHDATGNRDIGAAFKVAMPF